MQGLFWSVQRLTLLQSARATWPLKRARHPQSLLRKSRRQGYLQECSLAQFSKTGEESLTHSNLAACLHVEFQELQEICRITFLHLHHQQQPHKSTHVSMLLACEVSHLDTAGITVIERKRNVIPAGQARSQQMEQRQWGRMRRQALILWLRTGRMRLMMVRRNTSSATLSLAL